MYVTIESPLAKGPSQIFYRDEGSGTPIVHLHGGWGYAIYPLPTVAGRVVIPDRTGYGRSTRVSELPPRFHEAGAVETENVLAALSIERPILWGHSDGAVTAAIMGLRDPARYRGIVLEALHRDRVKPHSRKFFTDMAEDPMRFGSRVTTILERDHLDRWQDVIRMGGRAWLQIAATPDDAFYDHLDRLAVPTLVIHGVDDPRTEPHEMQTITRELAHTQIEMIDGGGHCPHAHSRTAAQVGAIVDTFVRECSKFDTPRA